MRVLEAHVALWLDQPAETLGEVAGREANVSRLARALTAAKEAGMLGEHELAAAESKLHIGRIEAAAARVGLQLATPASERAAIDANAREVAKLEAAIGEAVAAGRLSDDEVLAAEGKLRRARVRLDAGLHVGVVASRRVVWVVTGGEKRCVLPMRGGRKK